MGARTLVVGLAGAAYVVVSHWLMTTAPSSSWNAVVIVGPMLALVAVLAWRRDWRVVAALAAAALGGLAAGASLGGSFAPRTLYLAQHVGVHLALAVVFGATLAPGREPLIVGLATRVHRQLTPAMAHYCAGVTRLWTAYFLGMAILSIAIYLLLPFATWATFANFVTPAAMAALFVGEYLVRYRLHPEFERATLRAAIAAYARRSPAAAAARDGGPVATADPATADPATPAATGRPRVGGASTAGASTAGAKTR
ncbi:MAG: hypothetical protein ABI641_00230 [Caldimonas sp.]